MTPESENNLRLEIGHVLFLDLVGYSKLLIEEQKERLRQLTDIVLATAQVREATNEKLVRLSTGDGMALVFRNSSEQPAQCALEIARAIKDHPEIRVRMGVHSGPVSEVSDVNSRINIAGAGINMAQRVMDCGDAGHILLSKHVADDLEQYRQWQPHLHDLGECEVKHGIRVHIFNLYTEDAGNSAIPAKFTPLRKKTGTYLDAAGGGKLGFLRWGAIAAAILMFAALGFWLYRPKPWAKSPSTLTLRLSEATPTPAQTIPEKSIAVLPFDNLSGNPENAYFSEGIQEEILTRLAKIAELKVISRTSTTRYKSSPDNLKEIAKQLGVANILEGSVQRAGEQVRVNVQLIKAETDGHLWADTFDRKLTDIFAIESDIARTIADTLQAKLSGSEQHAIAAQPTDNSEAHQLYLKGRYFWNKRTGSDLLKAIDYFQQAIEKDSRYAVAYAGLADAYVLLPAFGAGAPRTSVPKAKAAARKALELDNSLAEAHTALAMALWSYDFDFNQSQAEFRRAIELNPNYATARMWYGTWVLMSLGQFDDGISEVKRALELDPLSLVTNTDLSNAYASARRYDLAIDQAQKTVELDQSFYYAHQTLGQALELRGEFTQAIAEYQKAYQLDDDPLLLGFVGHAYSAVGQSGETRKILNQLGEVSSQRHVPAYSFALLHLALGDKEEAIRWLEKGYKDREGWLMALIKIDPFLDPLRDDPRFEQLVAKVFSGAKPDE